MHTYLTLAKNEHQVQHGPPAERHTEARRQEEEQEPQQVAVIQAEEASKLHSSSTTFLIARIFAYLMLFPWQGKPSVEAIGHVRIFFIFFKFE